jgi:hypothetical protein
MATKNHGAKHFCGKINNKDFPFAFTRKVASKVMIF